MQTMYSAQTGSPELTLASDITNTDTTIPVNEDVTQLPSAPNLATIFNIDSYETVLYEGVDTTNNELTSVTRGFEGSAQSWANGTNVARLLTAYDIDSFKSNINENQTNIGNHTSSTSNPHSVTAAQVDIDTSLDFKDSYKLTNLIEPTNAQDSATKSYVDAIEQGLDIKDSTSVATEGNIDLTSATDPNPIDGVTLSNGDRVLLKSQTTASENGIYEAVTATDPTTWVRTSDADEDSEVTAGVFVFVESGTINSNRGFVLTTNDPITVGTTDLNFTQFSGAGQINAGTGLGKSGDTISHNTASVHENGGALEITHNNLSITSDDHHSKYTDSEAQSAINADGDHGSTASHNYYTDSDAQSAVTASDVGLGNVENIALSTATWTDIGISTTDITKSDVDLGNVPNTDIAYSSTIPADAFTSTEVSNLRAGQLDDGTTPWTSNNYYDNADAISAINNDSDHGSTASHNYYTLETHGDSHHNNNYYHSGDSPYFTGNVGIDVSSPGRTLEVGGWIGVFTGDGLLVGDSDWDGQISWNTSYINIGTNTGNSYAFRVYENDNVVVDTGSLGIGTTAPDQSIHTTGKTKSDTGFETGNFEVVHNSTEDSLDFNYIG